VYGEVYLRDEAFSDETSFLNPKNIYSASKASAEHIVRAFGRTFNMPYVIVRPSNNYGPNQDFTKFIPKMVDAALNERALQIYGDGKNFRQWVHVRDTAWAIWNLFNEGVLCDAYNIGGDDVLTNNEVARMILDATGSHSEIRYIEDRAGHDMGYRITSQKIKEHINFSPSISFKGEGLQSVIDYVKSRQ
jgi:dTDP-glucose 4,6-dehydratase